ncbi:lipopolysaccharide biosynthesis protein [Parabacteroides sp. PF5-6]|uniref:lipopolysaccharide biosynthesis protein n=1 Tax=Parabacteroides sp. PF5-6 TaxID=1742403 RepID=UPI002406E1EA|nr:lipopolysaccharide biosynthesis protein [Parabacteroides sp. PF5-6]
MTNLSLKEKTAKGLYWGGISSGLRQILSALFGIIFARILTQDDYGMVGVLSIFMGVASTIQEGGFTAALINRKEIKHEDYNAVFWFCFGASSLLYLLFFFCAPLIALFFKEPELVALSRVLFLWFWIGSMGIVHNALLLKKMQMKERAKIDVLALLLSNLLGVVLILNGYKYWGLVWQTVAYGIVATALRWYYAAWRPSLHFNFAPIKEMFPFSIKLVLTGFVTQVNNNILTTLLGRFYTKHEVGDYTQGNKWSTLGSSFVNEILQSVAQPVLVEANDNRDRQRHIFRKMLRFIAFISFPALFGLAFVAPELIVILITDKWMNSISIMQLLCVWGAFLPIYTTYTQLVIAHGKSNIYLINTLVIGLVQLLTLLFLYRYGILVMVIAFILINMIWLLVWHYYVHGLIGLKIWHVVKDIFPYMGVTLLVLFATCLITLPIQNIYLLLICKIGVAVILYVTIMKLTNSVMFKESVDFLLKKKRK